MSYLFSAVLVALVAVALFMPEASEARSYTGTWKSADGSFVAKIKKDQITIHIHADNITALYWKGTFKMRKDHTVISKADTKALESALLASTNKTKTFVERGSELRFQFSMLDVTQVVSLRRSA